ncbi:MAG: PilZ domain-containing protein [Deltaproteobacteria bacterium]|nr:PilZ domain-containing protein [Deltaproteobacteria bacterium]
MPAHGARNQDLDLVTLETVEGDSGTHSPKEDPPALEADVLVMPLAGDTGSFWARADEFSEQGLFLRTRKRLLEDALLILEVVFRNHTLPKLRFDAHVVHCIFGAGFGCRFVAVPRQLSQSLAQIVAGFR